MLEPSDKTLANTLENHAFACTKFGAYDKALKVSDEHECSRVDCRRLIGWVRLVLWCANDFDT